MHLDRQNILSRLEQSRIYLKLIGQSPLIYQRLVNIL